MRLFFKCSVFIIFFKIICPLSAQEYQEQVIPGELPDPSIIEVEDVYYAVGSSNDWGPIYPIYKSTDLKKWSFLTYVFDEKPDWTISSYWAPELFYYKDTFYCYYTARRTDGTSMIGVATTENIDQGFTDKGPLLEWGDEAIDPFVYNENGRLYLTWKAYGLTPDKPIQILGSELSDDGLRVKGNHFKILTADEDIWEKGGIEGQSIIKKGDYLYMFYAGNACCGKGCDYQVGIARSKTMKGPWEKYKNNPILTGNERWKCPGHGTPIETKGHYYYLYHAYPAYGFPYMGRSAILSELVWDDNLGWPTFKQYNEKSDLLGPLKENISDDFSSQELGHWWRYDIPNSGMDVKIQGGQLTLTESDSNNKTNNFFIGVNPEYADFTIKTKISLNNKSQKGLSIYVTKDNSLGIGVVKNELILWKIKEGEFMKLNQLVIDDGKEVYLKGKVFRGHRVEFFYKQGNGDKWKLIKNPMDKSNQIIGHNLSWWSWGIKAGLYLKANGIGGNRAVFDEFSIEYL